MLEAYEEIKVLLGDAAAAYTDEQIQLALSEAEKEAVAYCNRSLDDELRLIARKMAIIRLNRLSTEGLQGQSFSGVNESYINGYPAEIMMLLNKKRKVKFL